MSERIVVTGLGISSPLGKNVEEFWTAIKNGNSCIKKNNFAVINKEYYVGIFSNRNNLYNHIVDSCKEAIIDSEIKSNDIATIDSVCATSLGALHQFENKLFSMNAMSIEDIDMMDISYYSDKLKTELGINRDTMIVSSACSSGVNAIGIAYRMIKMNKCKRVMVYAYDFISEFIISGMRCVKGLSNSKMKPFDRDRNGMIIGECAASMIIESYSEAKKRNADIYCEIVGYNTLSEAHHLMVPDIEGNSISDCITYEDIERKEKVMLVSANGTKYNDMSIISGIKNNKKYDESIIMCIKAIMGHTLGASGLVEGIVGIKCLCEKILLPIWGLELPEFEMNYVTKNVQFEYDKLVQLSTSFGGNVASIKYVSSEE